jgi:hypothetical protein
MCSNTSKLATTSNESSGNGSVVPGDPFDRQRAEVPLRFVNQVLPKFHAVRVGPLFNQGMQHRAGTAANLQQPNTRPDDAGVADEPQVCLEIAELL